MVKSDGPIEKELIPKLTIVRRNLSSKVGVAIPDINLLYMGLSTPILYDFYNYRSNIPEYYLLLNDFVQESPLENYTNNYMIWSNNQNISASISKVNKDQCII
ncbi:hypothetical protein glysoja_043082 [Glycine soja]|uniref:Uncharacterized protein n=1 Tax=Glycine soja TaxID=3848 RepID=A0A0B2SSU5_GLYSO|nr:hypothetical protein glysoja_043082 [Glycine soja]